MLSIIAKWWIKPGCKKQALAALDELAKSTEQKEPFTTMYLIHTSVEEGSRPAPAPNEVIFVSAWPNRKAFQKHFDGPVFQDWKKKHIDLFLTNNSGDLFVTAEFMHRRAGYVRAEATGAP